MTKCKGLCSYSGRNILTALSGLVKALGRDDLATTEALLFDLTGSRVAALMLKQLFWWWSKAEDGWVYKSHLDWWAELRIKQNELPAANGALTNAGVEIELRKAEGAPTKHYRLNAQRFLERLARTLQISVKKLVLTLKNAFSAASTKAKNGFFQNEGEPKKSITTLPSTNPSTDKNAAATDAAIEEAKSVRGISDYTARQLVAQFGAERVMAAVKLIDSKPRTNPAGALIIALREHWECPAVEAPVAQASDSQDRAKNGDDPPAPDLTTTVGDTEPDGLPDDVPTETDTAEGAERTSPPGALSVPRGLPPVASSEGEEGSAARIWAMAAKQFEIQMGRATYEAYLRGLKPARVVGAAWIFRAASVPKMISDGRINRDMRRILGALINRDPDALELRYEEMGKAAL